MRQWGHMTNFHIANASFLINYIIIEIHWRKGYQSLIWAKLGCFVRGLLNHFLSHPLSFKTITYDKKLVYNNVLGPGAACPVAGIVLVHWRSTVGLGLTFWFRLGLLYLWHIHQTYSHVITLEQKNQKDEICHSYYRICPTFTWTVY